MTRMETATKNTTVGPGLKMTAGKVGHDISHKIAK
jgi:hypothetical protein